MSDSRKSDFIAFSVLAGVLLVFAAVPGLYPALQRALKTPLGNAKTEVPSATQSETSEAQTEVPSASQSETSEAQTEVPSASPSSFPVAGGVVPFEPNGAGIQEYWNRLNPDRIAAGYEYGHCLDGGAIFRCRGGWMTQQTPTGRMVCRTDITYFIEQKSIVADLWASDDHCRIVS